MSSELGEERTSSYHEAIGLPTIIDVDTALRKPPAPAPATGGPPPRQDTRAPGAVRARLAWDVKFFNDGPRMALWVTLACGVLLSGAYGVWHVYPDASATVFVARPGGRIVTCVAPVLLLSGCQYLLMLARRSRALLRFVAANEIMPYFHRALGWTVFLAGLVHAVAQTVNYARGTVTEPLWQPALWILDAEDRANGRRPTRQLLATGVLLVVMLTAMVLTASEQLRRRHYNTFWFVHTAGIPVVYILLVLHGTFDGRPWTWMFVTPAIVIYVINKALQRFRARYTLPIVSLRPSEECHNVTRVELAGRPWTFLAGQYANLIIPQLGAESHSFSIASAPDEDNLVFFVAAVGKWTRGLQAMAAAGPPPGGWPSAIVDGPFGAPADNFRVFPHLLLVGCGVGATPMVSVLSHVDRLHDTKEALALAAKLVQSQDSAPAKPAAPPATGGLRRNPVSHLSLAEAEQAASIVPTEALSSSATNLAQEPAEQPALRGPQGRTASGAPAPVLRPCPELTWRRQVQHVHHTHWWGEAFWLVNRISVLYLQMFLLMFMVAASLSLNMFDSRYALVPPLLIEAVTLLCFGIRLVGIATLWPRWRRQSLLRVLWVRIAATVFVWAVAAAHTALSIYALQHDNPSRDLLTADLALDLVHFFSLYFVLKLDLAMHRAPPPPPRPPKKPILDTSGLPTTPRDIAAAAIWQARARLGPVPKTVHFVWVVRTLNDCWYLERLRRLVHHGWIHADVYLTRHEPERDGPLPTERDITFHRGRPDWAKVLAQTTLEVPDTAPLGLFFCGAPAIADSLSQAVDNLMHAHPFRTIFFHEENF